MAEAPPVLTRRLGLPALGDGVGLRDVHFPHLMATPPAAWGVDWFETITENHLGVGGYSRAVLEHVAAHRPVVFHGVSLSIGSTEPLDRSYLHGLKQLIAEFKPMWVSDHLCWTGVQGLNTHDLLPLPYTEASLAHVADRVRAVQDYLGQSLILENPSTYLEASASTVPEAEFLARLVAETGCGLLVDVNNIHVSCTNHGHDPDAYLDALPMEAVVQVHLAGPTDCGTHLIDTHDTPVPDPVWQLYRRLWQRCGPVATLLEWDANIPSWDGLLAELAKAQDARNG